MLADLRQRLLDRLLGTGVDVCRRLIQNQYLRGVHQHASQRQQLLLPDGEIIALLAQLGVQPIAHAARHRRQLHRLQRFPNLRLTDVPAQRDVGVEGIRQHYGILLHHRDAPTQRAVAEGCERSTIDADLAVG